MSCQVKYDITSVRLDHLHWSEGTLQLQFPSLWSLNAAFYSPTAASEGDVHVCILIIAYVVFLVIRVINLLFWYREFLPAFNDVKLLLGK